MKRMEIRVRSECRSVPWSKLQAFASVQLQAGEVEKSLRSAADMTICKFEEGLPFCFDARGQTSSVEYPDGTTEVPIDAFINCTSIQRLTIPCSVTSIQPWGFAMCSSLTCLKFSHQHSITGLH